MLKLLVVIEMKFKDMNTPNKLTTIRMFCVPVVILLFTLFMLNNYRIIECDLVYRYGNYKQYYISLLQFLIVLVFAFASITDFIDGHLARKNGISTDFGRLMDPLADKLLVNTTMICMMAASIYALTSFEWYSIVAMVLSICSIARDVIVDALRMQALGKGHVAAAKIWGKLKTATLMPGIMILIFGSIYPVVYFTGLALVSIGSIFSLIGGVIYFNELKVYLGDA